ncbi:MAG: hypothetical protein ACOCP4_00825 [Candidatus Woesearchaeota archaeon]
MSKENFDVRIQEDKYTGINLSITHNGYQWSTISFKDGDELRGLMKVINDYLLYGITKDFSE